MPVSCLLQCYNRIFHFDRTSCVGYTLPIVGDAGVIAAVVGQHLLPVVAAVADVHPGTAVLPNQIGHKPRFPQ